MEKQLLDLLVFECYEIISALTAAVTLDHYSNVEMVTSHIATGSVAAKQQLMAYATSCIKPAIDYYTDHLAAPMSEPLKAFKAARLFSPFK